jgi:glycosyltransferase involved in cell wall biosynthesis
MATGTPVIAMELGSTSEVIAHGKTGFLCHSVDECVAAIDKAVLLNRRDCRNYVQQKFSAETMTDGYEAVYRQILSQRFSQNGHLHTASLTAV